MAILSAQIEEMEEDLYAAHSRVDELNGRCDRMEGEISDLEDQVAEYEDYIEWIEETYPEARTAYEAKQRLDQAA